MIIKLTTEVFSTEENPTNVRYICNISYTTTDRIRIVKEKEFLNELDALLAFIEQEKIGSVGDEG